MEPGGAKLGFLRNVLVRVFLLCVSVVALRFAYLVVIRGESCDAGDFCFFSLPEDFKIVGKLTKSSSSSVISSAGESAPARPEKIPDLWATDGFQKAVRFYSAVFEDLFSEAVLSPHFRALCVDTENGADVYALREMGVEYATGISKKPFQPMVVSGQGFKQPFRDEVFDFTFCGGGAVEKTARPGAFAAEIRRTLKPEGFLVIHTAANDTYSFQSLLSLFSFCRLIKSREIHGFDPTTPLIHEVVLQKINGDNKISDQATEESSPDKCSVPDYKRDLLSKIEPLIEEEPRKPWITLKHNLQKMKYLPSLVDISFKPRYVYIDVGSRSYGSSIVAWFKKQYPKQNRTFDIYAIEADRAFHDEYKLKKGVTLLPHAAWVRNETLSFEISDENAAKGRGMGRIRSANPLAPSSSVDWVQGFDFAEWLKGVVVPGDFVVVKMDVEGAEFELIPRLIETGAICLIDELMLECHYNRWQKCCPGERSGKYGRRYGECLDLYGALRKKGVHVHQWW